MNISDNAARLREMIEKAIDDGILTRDEYDKILHLATEDGIIDRHEQILLSQLQEMIADKSVRLTK